jgi:serine phosphatase RsbU (regulator of sigma subunit)
MKPDTKVSWTFLTACLFLSLWVITIFDMQSTHYGFIRLYLISSAFFPAAFVHFSLYFPEPRRFILKYPRLQILPYLIFLMIITPMEYLYPHKGFVVFYFLAQAYMIVAALAVLYPVTAEYFRPTSVLARQRAKVVLLGAALAFPIQTSAYFSQLVFGSFLGLRIQTNLLALPLMIFPASIAYAIAKHNLFDVDVYIKRAVGYAILTAFIVGAYMVVSIPLNILVGRYQVAQSRAFPILFTLAVILVFNPLRNRIQAFVDRVFFRREYDYGKIVEKMGAAMTSLLDLGQILKRLVGTFMEDMFIDTSSVMLLSPAKAEYQIYLADGDYKTEVEKVIFHKEDPIMQILQQEKRELTKYDVLEDPKYKRISEEGARNFETLHASLMVPLVYQDELIGLLNLGDKKSGRYYSREDIDLLHTLANQSAVAIENARLFQESLEKQRMEEELTIARDLQTSMLPATCPEIEGFEIAATSIPAREVGGDFFDFIDMGKDRAGLVIADVTGKSVSGALVMSASRSVFRMLSEEELTVGEIMNRANRRTKKDIKSGMFVALLYAVIDARDQILSLSSAGQTQPIYLSAETGEAKLVETEGDTFPLGILDDAEYEETRIQLAPGDKVVFYTDGIVEAMNEQEELYGFDRLLETVQEARSMGAESLLKEVVDKVNEFAGGAAQHDDLTVIVLSVDK